jgi:hypothetical protein
MVWLLIYYVYTNGAQIPTQLAHEYLTKAECERAASILDQTNPYSHVMGPQVHVCLGVARSH